MGLASEFVVKTGETGDALTLKNLGALDIENLVFVGVYESVTDARITLALHNIDRATVHYCEFYGLATLVPGGSILYAEGCDLRLEDSAFLGTTADSGQNTSVVQNYNWKGVTVSGTRFIGYDNRPDFLSKAPLASPYSWICIGGAAATSHTDPLRQVVIRGVFLDEGGYQGLAVRPDVFTVSGGSPISLFFISGLDMNVTNLAWIGIYVNQVENVFIERSHFG